MNYPVVIHKDPNSDYGVTVPDLPGCISAGRNWDEALAMAKEAIELHIEGLLDEGLPVPKPGRIEKHRELPDFAGGTWAIVSVAESRPRISAKRINITVPERVLESIDRFALEHGKTRSGLIVEAAIAYMAPKKAATKLKRKQQTQTRA